MENLKLYVWEGVLSDWTSGIIFALADNVENAVKQVKTSCLGNGSNSVSYENCWNGNKFQGVEPVVYENPMAYAMWGGG